MDTLQNTYNRTLDLEDQLNLHISNSSKKLSTLSTQLDSMDTKQQDLLNTVSDIQSAIDANTQALSTQQSALTSLQSSVDTNTQKIADNTQSINNHTTAISTLETDVNDVAQKVDNNAKILNTQSATISTLQSSVDTNIQNIDANSQDISSLTTLVNSKENVSNKTTSLTSSSTDTQYPSAKAVYDALNSNSTSVTLPTTYYNFYDYYTLAQRGDSSVTADYTLHKKTLQFVAPAGTQVYIVMHMRIRSDINQTTHNAACQVGLYVNSTQLMLYSARVTENNAIYENTLCGTFTATGNTDTVIAYLYSLNGSSLVAMVSALVEITGTNITIK